MSKPDSADGSRNTRSVERALDLLDLVARSADGTTLSSAARDAELATSTAARLLQSLAATDFVTRDEHGRYRAGPRLYQIGALAVGNLAIYSLSERHLRGLAEATGETAYVGLPVEGASKCLYLRQVESPHAIRHAHWAGLVIETPGTAIGAALHDQVGPGGFVLSRATRIEPDAAAAAAPVRDTSGSVIAALSIIGPSFRLPDEELERIGAIVAQSAADLSEELGYVEDASAPTDHTHPIWTVAGAATRR
ncbi:IclR family transcriptional regulator [Ornithinimicrobium cavernae]|uniref:IclR family transcriptional regulator n=1 Tax=Ornithinimicrobium cavernae TaxID=2666047 RepID=UPI000D6971DF|nr:helix-turn-helix domain-containing protein [Ornithinimicrobium cavernae]